jgi:lysine 2,3-aminomutase
MNWVSEFQTAIKSNAALEEFFQSSFPKNNPYPIFLPLELAKKIRSHGIDSPLGKQFLPSNEEVHVRGGFVDPIGDLVHQVSSTKQLIHRYPNRALFLPTTTCPVICRFCFRKNELYETDGKFHDDFSHALEYLKSHPEIQELIFTGGDPFSLSTQKLQTYLEHFAQLSHIKYVRFHTRYPVIMPSRFLSDPNLLQLLRHHNQSTHQKILIAIHTNHLDEWGEDENAAAQKLKDSGIELLSQTVLMKGINDHTKTLLHLFQHLIGQGIRPYYLHHPDTVKGAMHFSLTLSEGRMIYNDLRNHLPGWAIPHYVIDIPGGHGKVSAFNPETFDFSGNLITRQGQIKKLIDT